MNLKRWYRGTAEPKIEDGRGRIQEFSHRVSEFVRGDAPVAVKAAAVAAVLILMPLFFVMVFLMLSTAFFAALAVKSRRRRGLFFNGRIRRPARMW